MICFTQNLPGHRILSDLKGLLESISIVQLHYFVDEKIGLERSDLTKNAWPLKLQSQHSNLDLLIQNLGLTTRV